MIALDLPSGGVRPERSTGRSAPTVPSSVVAVAHRVGVAVFSAVLLMGLAWPAVAPGEHDGLPLSNYPMFAHRRSAVSQFHVAVNIDVDGVEHRLDPHQIGGTDQPMQAVMTVRQAIVDGGADELCAAIAERADHPGTVEIATVSLDSVGWFAGTKHPLERNVHASCPVDGR